MMKTHTAGFQSTTASPGRMAKLRILVAALAAVGVFPAAVSAQSGSWTQVAGSPANWGTAANWSGNTIANGIDSTATFATPGLTGPFTVSLDASRIIGNLVFDNP